VFAAEWGVGQVLWSLIWFMFIFIYIWILITVVIDIFRDHKMSGWAKAVWVVALLIFPFITLIVYLIARGGDMHARSIEAAKAQQKAMNEYIRETAGTSGASAADQIAQGHKLLESGAISQAEFDALKAKALA
jgi:ABC-type multidrug transport system fused ATPase/permease subunit